MRPCSHSSEVCVPSAFELTTRSVKGRKNDTTLFAPGTQSQGSISPGWTTSGRRSSAKSGSSAGATPKSGSFVYPHARDVWPQRVLCRDEIHRPFEKFPGLFHKSVYRHKIPSVSHTLR